MVAVERNTVALWIAEDVSDDPEPPLTGDSGRILVVARIEW